MKIMGRNSALLNIFFLASSVLIGVPIAVLFPWVEHAPTLALLAAAIFCAFGFCLFASAKVATIRQGRLLSWGSADMTPVDRRCYRTGYALLAFAAILGLCLVGYWGAR